MPPASWKSTHPRPTEDLEAMSVGSPPPQQPPAPPWLSYLNPGRWPKWFKYLAMPVLFVVLVFYFRDQRVGNGLFAPSQPAAEPQALSDGVAVRTQGVKVEVGYLDGSWLPADGLGVALVTREDDAKAPDRLNAFRGLLTDQDFPLVVFLNASGFDATGEPVVIRRAKDGKELYRSPNAEKVLLCVAQRDGRFRVFVPRGMRTVDEQTWVEKYMRLKYEPLPPDPKADPKQKSPEVLKQRPPAEAPKGTKDKGVSLRVVPLRLPQEKK